jgi:aminoglycoside phosphotransferase (APT) family kinase protein
LSPASESKSSEPGASAARSAWQDVDEGARTEGLVDVDALARWMDERGLPGKGEPLEAIFISGGSSNEIFEIRRGEHHVALRRPPRVVPEGRNKTMLREYRVLEALNGTDVPHPEAIAVCDDERVIGACFYLMGHVDGWSPMGMGDRWPEPFDGDLKTRHGLGIQLVDGIARLARVDWRGRGLEGFGKPDGFLERQADRWISQYETLKVRDLEGVDAVADWLRANTPSVYEPGIIHGDYQFANVMYQHGAPARLAAIVDWEMATVGDPLLDLGWVIQGWPEEGADMSGAGYVPMEGMPQRSELLAHYADVSGRPTTEIAYYEILAGFKLAIVLEGQYSRFKSGKLDNPKIEAFGDIVPGLMLNAAAKALCS